MRLIANETVEAPATPDDQHARVVQWVENAESEGVEARELSEKDRDYYDGRQLTHEEAAELKRRNQPVIAFNLIQSKVDYLLGLERQQRSDPKAYPRTPQDQDAAEAATDAIRYVCDNNDLPQLRSQGWENMIVEGACGYDVCAQPGPNGEMEIVLHTVHWDRMIWDPHSRERDFSDANWLAIINWMDRDDVLAKWPDAEDVLNSAMSTPSTETFEDRPRWNVWADNERARVRVCQMYWKEREEWQFGTFTRGGWLDEPMPSPYTDEAGKPACALIFQSSYVDRQNKRYGSVRNLIDPQDEINLRHRKAVHLLSVRQVVAEQGAVADVDVARREMSKPDGYIEVAPGMRFDISPTTDLSMGQAQLLQEAKAIFQSQGPNAALMGKQGKEASGRAIALSQQGGVMELGALLDLHRHAQRRICRAIWDRIKQYWTAEKWVRITDDERNIRFAGLNTPVTLEQKLQEMPPEQAQQIAMQMGLMPGDPRLQQVVDIQNNVSEMTVDIVIEEGPDVATLQIEQFQALADLARGGVPIPPDVLIQASTLRNKDQILERMQQMGQQPNPAMIEIERKAAKDKGDLAIDAGRLKLDTDKAQMEALTQMAQAMPPPLLMPAV